jgi:hypothetical protein
MASLDAFEDAKLKYVLWLKQKGLSGNAPDYTREAGLEGLLEYRRNLYDVLIEAHKYCEAVKKEKEMGNR